MSFEMAFVIGVGQSELIDVTPPVVVGDERNVGIFSMGPFDKNARQVEMQAIQPRLYGRLPDISVISDSRVAAVLRWFTKSLTVYLHDQFIFLWIALEILSDDSTIKVETVYRASCGHEIPTSPTCGVPTSRQVLGLPRRAFLVSLGVSERDARSLWQMRQLMHGAISFDSDKLDKLPSLVQVLRAAVAAGLKVRLGMSPEGPPLVAPSGLATSPMLGLGGTRAIREKDLEPL
jgi:hypothetical protein